MLNTKLFPILPTLLTSVALLSACAGTDTTIDEDPPQNQNQEQEQVETTETTDTSENTDTSETISLAVLGTTDIHAHLLPYDYMNDEVERIHWALEGIYIGRGSPGGVRPHFTCR